MARKLTANKKKMPYLIPILLLVASKVFMTTAWYGHLKYKHAPLALAAVMIVPRKEAD